MRVHFLIGCLIGVFMLAIMDFRDGRLYLADWVDGPNHSEVCR